MKKWKKVVALGMFAVCLTSCKDAGSVADTAGNGMQTQGESEPDGTEADDAVKDTEDVGEGQGAAEGAGEETPAADAEEIKMSNPMQEVSGTEELLEIGVSMGVPEEAENVQCFIISQVVAEVNFELGETAYAYRGSATAEDFAGIFEEFEEDVLIIPGSEGMGIDGDLTVKTTVSGGRLASWSKNGAGYTLYTPSFVEEDVFVALCGELMEKN